ncbi:MAG: hypothetical protein IPN53_03345 [Comamonadaceae bacterium]|nr:hypothetical protein [Comamonadaceae bacterium]
MTCWTDVCSGLHPEISGTHFPSYCTCDGREETLMRLWTHQARYQKAHSKYPDENQCVLKHYTFADHKKIQAIDEKQKFSD